ADGPALAPVRLPYTGDPEHLTFSDPYYSPDGVRCLAASPDGAALFVGGWDHDGLLLDPADGSVRGRLTGHEGPITSAAFTADGTRLLTGGADKTVRLWDAAARRLLQTWAVPGAPRYLGLAPDGSRAVVQAENQGRLL